MNIKLSFFLPALLVGAVSMSSFNLKSELIEVESSEIIGESKIKITCYYSFENVTNEMQIEQLKAEISLLTGVSEIKSIYKPEKNRGQIIVVIIQEKRTSEGQEMFDITLLKKAIINQGLAPLEVSMTEEVIN